MLPREKQNEFAYSKIHDAVAATISLLQIPISRANGLDARLRTRWYKANTANRVANAICSAMVAAVLKIRFTPSKHLMQLRSDPYHLMHTNGQDLEGVIGYETHFQDMDMKCTVRSIIMIQKLLISAAVWTVVYCLPASSDRVEIHRRMDMTDRKAAISAPGQGYIRLLCQRNWQKQNKHCSQARFQTLAKENLWCRFRFLSRADEAENWWENDPNQNWSG